MIARLDDATFIFLMSAIAVGSIGMGWLADAILKAIGFGMIMNAILVAIGGFGAVFLMDWLAQRAYLGPDYLNPYAGTLAVAGAGTLALLAACIARAIATK